jgi:hypothetical protein
MTGKILHAQLHLMDRQLVDYRSGALLGKVDDVELDLSSEIPVVAALISGRQRIPAADIAEIDSAVKLTPYDLNLTKGDDWVKEHFIGKIPGAGNETD